jgi:anti-sigma-K factor RskA
MDAESLHELTAAYALDALDPDEREAFEEHLAGCERCRAEVAALGVTATGLAFAAPAASPPPELRSRILEAARAERPNVAPLPARRVTPVRVVAVAAAFAAITLAVWDVLLHDQLSQANHQALRRVPVSGASGSLVVASGGSAVLVLYRVGPAPAGRTYEAWVVRGASALPAGLFRGGSGATFVPIARTVPRGAVVAVTVEPAGGSARPTSKPFAVSQPV